MIFLDNKQRLIMEIEGTNSGVQMLYFKPRILEALKGEETSKKKKYGGDV